MAEKTGLSDLIIRSMRDGPQTIAGIYKFTDGQYARARVIEATEKLRVAGLVMRQLRRYELTKTGRAKLPPIESTVSLQGRYRSPVVVRRPGTEIHRTLPSRVGDQLHYREQA